MDSAARYPTGESPITENQHKFLTKLDNTIENPSLTQRKIIKDIAKKTIKPSMFESSFELVKKSITTLKHDYISRSPSKTVKEISGAQKALQLLLFTEKNPDKKKIIHKELKELSEFQNHIQTRTDTTVLHSQMLQKKSLTMQKLPTEVRQYLKNDQFRLLFEELMHIYGVNHPIDLNFLQTLFKITSSHTVKSPQPIIHFLKAITQAKEDAFALLDKGDYPTQEMQKTIIDTFTKMNAFVAPFSNKELTDQEYLDFHKQMLGILSKSPMNNPQIHDDGLANAFTSDIENTGPEGREIRKNKAIAEEYQKNIISISTETTGSEQIKEKMSRVKANKGYKLVTTGHLEKAEWQPLISSTEPLEKVRRVIGFKYEGEAPQESETLLDLSFLNRSSLLHEVTGEGNHISLEQREQLGNFLKVCNQVFKKNPQWVKQVDSLQKIPPKISQSLKEMEWLTKEEQLKVLQEVAQFTYNVNARMLIDRMNL